MLHTLLGEYIIRFARSFYLIWGGFFFFTIYLFVNWLGMNGWKVAASSETQTERPNVGGGMGVSTPPTHKQNKKKQTRKQNQTKNLIRFSVTDFLQELISL